MKMNLRDLRWILNKLPEEQLDCALTVAVKSQDGVEVYDEADFIDPKHIFYEDSKSSRKEVALDEIDGILLEKNHPYIFIEIKKD
jgi:hypothetical protein